MNSVIFPPKDRFCLFKQAINLVGLELKILSWIAAQNLVQFFYPQVGCFQSLISDSEISQRLGQGLQRVWSPPLSGFLIFSPSFSRVLIAPNSVSVSPGQKVSWFSIKVLAIPPMPLANGNLCYAVPFLSQLLLSRMYSLWFTHQSLQVGAPCLHILSRVHNSYLWESRTIDAYTAILKTELHILLHIFSLLSLQDMLLSLLGNFSPGYLYGLFPYLIQVFTQVSIIWKELL